MSLESELHKFLNRCAKEQVRLVMEGGRLMSGEDQSCLKICEEGMRLTLRIRNIIEILDGRKSPIAERDEQFWGKGYVAALEDLAEKVKSSEQIFKVK